MISKRSFFKKLGAVIAAVAIAPEIAFRQKLELPSSEPQLVSFSWQTSRYSACIDNEYSKRMAELEASGIIPVMKYNLQDFLTRKDA